MPGIVCSYLASGSQTKILCRFFNQSKVEGKSNANAAKKKKEGEACLYATEGDRDRFLPNQKVYLDDARRYYPIQRISPRPNKKTFFKFN